MIYRTPIETSRLLLQQESLSNFERFYGMSVDPEAMKYIGDGSVFRWTEEVALDKFKEAISGQYSQTLGNLAVYRKEGNEYIGWCGISYSKFLDHMEIGYRFCRDSWGKGYATEATSAILGETYEVSDLDDILACVHPDNAPSIRVLEKLGFRFSHPRLSKPIGRDIPVYRIDRKAYTVIAAKRT